ncbi:pantetheinase [Plakobranchus ocellatus]|uniref:Pantetheinase n=1 Tax=Plakobranchus ocellatus TaxID=259542 RepID=A0AAV3ZMJ4_9GAST|nr:pantetheinase [Plakobranchus ocellatus]
MLSILKRATLIVMAVAFLRERKAVGDSPGVNIMSISRPTFKAAVYAHAVYIPVDPYVVSRAQAVENMKINLHIYRFRAAQAKKQNAEIIVFPEDGIYGMMFSRETIYPYLEQIPDPQSETWVPCDDPHRHKDSDVQVTLSCLAKANHLYLVANMGDKQPCDPLQDPKCPEDKRDNHRSMRFSPEFNHFLDGDNHRNMRFSLEFNHFLDGDNRRSMRFSLEFNHFLDGDNCRSMRFSLEFNHFLDGDNHRNMRFSLEFNHFLDGDNRRSMRFSLEFNHFLDGDNHRSMRFSLEFNHFLDGDNRRSMRFSLEFNHFLDGDNRRIMRLSLEFNHRCSLRFSRNIEDIRPYQFNTDVAYGPDGKFLAKYHKHNLFYEDQFDTAPPSHVYFDTPFGRVGLMTCFDVLFEEPGIPLVEKNNVTIFAFPTGWRDALPLLPALGFHSSFARALGVNFLAANLHLPEFGFDGSGLYAPDGAHAFYYGSGSHALSPKLLVSEMDVLERSHRKGFISYQRHTSSAEHKSGPLSIVDNSFEQPLYDIPSSAQFESVLFYDTYTFKTLDQLYGKLEVCQNQLCCQLEYAFGTNPFKIPEMYAFGAFDGLHTHDGNYYMQNCVLVKCADALNKKSCGQATKIANTFFTKISMQGQFSTPYVYPQIITSDGQGQLGIFKPGAWDFNGTSIETNPSFNSSIISAVLLGRDYGKD